MSPPSPRRSAAGRFVRWAALSVAGLVAAIALGLYLLGLPSVQRGLLDRALGTVAERAGLEVTVDRFGASLSDGRVEAGGLSFRVRGQRPFLEMRGISARLALRRALRGDLALEDLSVDGLRLDLSAPLPPFPATGGEGPLLPQIELGRVRVGIDSIVSGPLPPSLQPYLTGVRMGRATLAARLSGGKASVVLDAPDVAVDRPGSLRVAAAVHVEAAVENPDRIVLRALSVTGDRLRVDARGSVALSGPRGLSAVIEGRIDPDAVAPELGVEGDVDFRADASGTLASPRVAVKVSTEELDFPDTWLESSEAEAVVAGGRVELTRAHAVLGDGGTLQAEGGIDLASRDARLWLRGEGVTAAALEPFLGKGKPAALGLEDAVADATATAVFRGRGDRGATGEATVTFRRGETVLARAHGLLDGEAGARLDLTAELLPEAEGERSASLRLEAARPAALAEGRLTAGRFRVVALDLGSAWSDLHGAFPRIVPRPPPGVDLGGPARVDVRLAGTVKAPEASFEAGWTPAEGRLAATGSFALRTRSGTAKLTARDFPLGLLVPGAEGRVWADLAAAGDLRRYLVSLDLDAAGACSGPGSPTVDALHLSAEADPAEVRVFDLAAESGGASARLAGRASTDVALLDADATGTARWRELSVALSADVRRGLLSLDVPFRLGSGDGALAATLPLGALRRLPAASPLAAFASRVPVTAPDGLLWLSLDAPGADACAAADLAGLLLPFPEVTADLAAVASLDPADPDTATARLAVSGLAVPTPVGTLRTDAPLEAELADRVLKLLPGSLRGEKTLLTGEARIELSPGALAGRAEEPVAAFAAKLRGSAEAALLDPFLVGGKGQGSLAIDADVHGGRGALGGTLALSGPGARLLWPLPYPTEVRDPDLAVDLSTLALTRGSLKLNGGFVDLSGGRAPDGGLALDAIFGDVRYRLAYGLAATFEGVVELRQSPGGERLLSGVVTLDRGLLDRDVDLDRELLVRLLAPPESEGTETGFLDTLRLSLDLTTTTGVKVRNNLADLRAVWGTLSLTGTARSPIVRGRIDVERGGLVYAYGQTFRIDRGSVVYAGDPATDPRLDFVTTSSLEDPSLARSDPGAALGRAAAARSEAERDAASELAKGLAGYYGERLASQLNQALGVVKVSLRPVLIFGEADPGTRLTVSRDFSRQVSLAVAVDLKNAQRQTFVLDLHDLPRIPPLTAQAFTDDTGTWGATLQQRILLGGSRPEPRGDAPVLRKVVVEAPAGVSRGALVRSLGLVKDDPLGPGSLFDAESDAERTLRAKGYPDSRVTARELPVEGKPGRVDLELSVEPGTRAEVAFEGAMPPAATRPRIVDLYRGGLLEPSALADVTKETVRVFRSLGYLDPDVEVRAEDARARAGEPLRRVTVTTTPGARAAIGPPSFPGAPPGTAALLAARFPTLLARVELARGEPSADRRLLDSLRGLGYPLARLVSRDLSADGTALTVAVDPGPPSLVDSVEVRGVPPEEAARLRSLVAVVPDEPARTDRIAAGAVAIEEELARSGYADAGVRTTVGPASPEVPPRLAVRYAVSPGREYRVGNVAFAGEHSTSPSFLARTAGLEPGSPFRRADVDRARGSLFDLGLFSSVRSEVTKRDDGLVDVLFRAREQPRFSIAYGARWEDPSRLSAVVDLLDRNAFGRGLVVGVRGLYDADDRSARLYVAAPGLFASPYRLEGFLERRRRYEDDPFGTRQQDTTEATLQLARPIGRSLVAHLYGRYSWSRTVVPDPFFGDFVTEIRFPYAGFQLLYDTREDPLLGSRGLFASLDLQGSGGVLGSDFSYLRAYGQVNLYSRVASLRTGPVLWAQSVRAGFAKALQGQDLIPDVRFRAGGDYSVRGYPREELGPHVEIYPGFVDVPGGSTLFILNEELRVSLHPRLQGVAFVDVGQVWTSSRDFLTDLRSSLGLGLRGLTPVGVLRLDAAWPLQPYPGDPGFKLYFGFGNSF